MATEKQRRAIKILSENPGIPLGKAMVQAGYSESSSLTPQRHLIQTAAYREYLEQAGVTDEVLATKLKEGLDATKAVVMGVKSEESFVDIQPDFATRHKYLETALRVKGHTKPEDEKANVTVNIALVEFIGDEKDQNPTS